MVFYYSQQKAQEIKYTSQYICNGFPQNKKQKLVWITRFFLTINQAQSGNFFC